MTHAESLERLAHAAEWGANWRDSTIEEDEALDAALSHGAAAVRAINLLRDVPSLNEPAGYLSGATGEEIPSYAVSESRLAFRAACEAVGIRADRDGHHNL